jgi:hypothetical protein
MSTLKPEISAGNDIVSLSVIDPMRTVQPRFYSKILSLSEQELYSGQAFPSLPFEHFVWLLWSIKESAYKYFQRIDPDLVFSPTRVIVSQLLVDDGFYRGIVHSRAGTVPADGSGAGPDTGLLYSRSILHADHISTVVSDDKEFERVWWETSSIDRTDHAGQSAAVRSLLLDKLRELLPSGHEGLEIQKTLAGCPVIVKGGERLGIPVSLAHHGRFIAYSFRLQATGAPLSSPDFA